MHIARRTYQSPICSSRTVLIVVDMQNAFLEKNALIPMIKTRKIIPNISKLIKIARRNEINVVWTRAHHNSLSNSEYKRLHPTHFDSEGMPFLTTNSRHFEIIDELSFLIEPMDIIVDKDWFSAFHGTNLYSRLRGRNIQYILFSGIATNICVESTLRDAVQLDFTSILVSDCSATLTNKMHEASLNNISLVFGYVMEMNEIAGRLSN